MSSLRLVAQLIFENVDEFGQSAFLDWAQARDVIARIADDPKTKVKVPDGDITQLNKIGDWGEFFRSFASHNLFSQTPTLEGVVKVWEEIRGFDVDGLLDIGDPEGLQPRLTDELASRYVLGKRVKLAGLVGEDALADAHVHFGQVTDLGLLWHHHLRETACYWSEYAPKVDRGATFRERRRALEAAPPPGFARTTSGEKALPNRIGTWATNMARARLLFSYYVGNDAILRQDAGNEAAKEFLFDALDDNRKPIGDGDSDHIMGLERQHRDILSRSAQLSIEESIVAERRLIAALAGEAPLARGFAAAYLSLKSGAMNAVCGNSVDISRGDGFRSFTVALKALDHIYGRSPRIFGHEEAFVSQSSRHLREGAALPKRLLYRVSEDSMKLGASGQFRPFAKNWKTASALYGESDAKLVLTFQRSDFITKPDAYREVSRKIIEKMADWERELSCEIVGIDLCGPEARDSYAIGSSDGEQAPTSMVLDPIDRIFELREELTKKNERPIHVSFHSGEHVVDWELGLLSTLSILTDPRFSPDADRLSHALILGCSDEAWEETSPKTTSARDAACNRVRRNCEADANSLFDQSERAEIMTALDALAKGSDADLRGVCESLRRKVLEGKIIVEVCPHSNLMVRNLPPARHPWREAVAKGRIQVGTDDPALTQTLPWIEYAALTV